MSAPKVFVSHASEDKDRFVLGFATRLRQNGIDAWLDRWEMLPGDSVVDKIFEEGIKDAAAFIVVLSSVSTGKKWVREEMNAAFIARLSRQCKVIPVIIDDCDVPEALKTTLWERIPDLADYDEQLKRIVSAILDLRDKPALGDAPAYVTAPSADFAKDLSRTDAAVFRRLCESAFDEGHDVVGDLGVLDELEEQGISGTDILEAIEILEDLGLIKTGKVLGGGYRGGHFFHVRITLTGHEKYLRYRFPNYDEMVTRIASLIVNEDLGGSKQLTDASGYPAVVVEHIVDLLENNTLVTVSRTLGGFHVHSASPRLKRMLQ